MTASEVIAMVADAGGEIEVTKEGGVRLTATNPLPPIVVKRVRENKAAVIDDWPVRKRWRERWPDKPFAELRMKDGTIDSDVGAWVSEQLRRAGTRFLRVDDKNSLAIWPEQDGPEFHLAMQLADLDHLDVHSRDEPRIQRLLSQQHPGRP
jgi:hypothetical protein